MIIVGIEILRRVSRLGLKICLFYYFKITEANLISVRGQAVEAAIQKLTSAVERRNLQDICSVLEESVNMTIPNKYLDSAKQVRKELQEEIDSIVMLANVIQTVSNRRKNPSGIATSELALLRTALDGQKTVQHSALYTQHVEEAKLLLRKCEEELQIQTELTAALLGKNLQELKVALEKAQKLGIKVMISYFLYLFFLSLSFFHAILLMS